MLLCASTLMYVTKSDFRMKHDTHQDFRTSSQNESKAVITNALQIRHCSHRKRIINALNENGVTISNSRALQIKTSLANAVIKTLKISPRGIEFFPFLEKDKFIQFPFDNTDLTVNTTDGKNQMRGGLIVLFQNGESNGEQKQPEIDLTSKT